MCILLSHFGSSKRTAPKLHHTGLEKLPAALVRPGRTGVFSEGMCDDREEVLKRVTKDGNALDDASENLKGDREIVMQAVLQDGRALQFASEELKGDREIVMQAICKRWQAMQFASEQLKGDREIACRAIAAGGWAFQFASEELRGDRDIAEAALANVQDPAVVLKVTLLSGRSCSQIYYAADDEVQDVLRESANLLDMDPDTLVSNGALMIGSRDLKDLTDLEVGKVHEVTLLLT